MITSDAQSPEDDKNDNDDDVTATLPLSHSDDNASQWYTIERILKHRRKRGKDEYYVKWQDYDEKSWVSRENLTEAALQEYYRNRKPRRRKRRN